MSKTRRKARRIRSVFNKDNLMKTVAVHAIKRADSDTTKTLSRAGVTTVHEAQEQIGLVKPYMRPVYAGGTRHVLDSKQMQFPV